MLNNAELMESLDTVTSIPVIPFRNGSIDYEAHGKNIDYMMSTNDLDGKRRRIIGIAGTSLIHHVGVADQVKLMDYTGQRMGDDGVLISGIVPNPIGAAEQLVEAQASASRPPDAYLVMPLGGVASPEGIYDYYMGFAERLGGKSGARFLYYLRSQAELEVAVRLINNSAHFVGIKIGTGEEDVEAIVAGVNKGSGLVMWGIGDRSTAAARLGTKGHTSGISVVFARASDQINNAQRSGDFDAAQAIEEKVKELEDIRFRNGRMYNYSAVVEAMRLSNFGDIDGGVGGPFNPPVPAAVSIEIEAAIAALKEYH